MSVTVFVRTPLLKSGGKQTAGPSDRDMVCCGCYRFFVLNESSWKAAESKACPYCGCRDTTPMLGEYDNSVPVLVIGPDGGFI